MKNLKMMVFGTAVASLFAVQTQASEYVVGAATNTWTYSEQTAASTLNSITSTSWGNIYTYSNFANKGALSVAVYSGTDNRFWKAVKGSTGSWTYTYLGDLSAAVGTSFSTSSTFCGGTAGKISAKGASIQTAAGTFSDTVTFSCGNNAIIFAKTVGVISAYSHTVSTQCYAAPCPTMAVNGYLKTAIVNGVSYPVAAPVNQTPVAVNDSYNIENNTRTFVGVLDNDTDSDGAIVTTSIAIAANPAHGIVEQDTAGNVFYTPATGFSGTDTFKYTVTDNGGAVSNQATVTLTVKAAAGNQAPVANADAVTTAYQTAITINVLANDTDTDGTLNTSSVLITQNPFDGTVLVNANGTITYTPNTGYAGTDGFSYTVADNQGLVSAVGVVSVTVSANVVVPVNLAPSATAAASSFYPNYPVRYLNDNTSSPWMSSYVYAYQVINASLTWTAVKHFTYVELEWQGAYYPAQYEVLVYKNGVSTSMGLYYSKGGVETVSINSDADKIVVNMTNRSGNTYLSLKELRAYGN